MTFRSPLQVLTFLEPAELSARATIVVVPGRGEQPEVYRRFGTRLSVDAYRVHVVRDPTVDAAGVQRQLQEAFSAAVASAPLVVVGSDTGALFAAGLAAEDRLPDVDALILAGLPNPGGAADVRESWDDELGVRTTCPTHRAHISASLVTPGALYDPIPENWSERASLREISRPILGIHGQDDPISPLEWAREAYAAAASSELVGVAGARHDVLNDRSHRTVAATTVLWLERLVAGNGLAPIAIPERVGVDVA